MLVALAELKRKLELPLLGFNSHFKMAPESRADKLLKGKDEYLRVKQSAVLILLFPDNGQLKTVYIKRSEYEGIHSGQIAFPGGQYEESDRNFETTALRETFEEIGVEGEKIEIIGKLTDLFIPASNFMVKVFIGYSTEKPRYLIDKKEVQSVIEINIEDLYRKEIITEKEFGSGIRRIKAPCYKIKDIEIWGATAMITSELLDALKA
jgi:8-oxo-dGTP pyrophosphatase MutT (NUDIX family)